MIALVIPAGAARKGRPCPAASLWASERLIDEQVQSGRYGNASEVVRGPDQVGRIEELRGRLTNLLGRPVDLVIEPVTRPALQAAIQRDRLGGFQPADPKTRYSLGWIGGLYILLKK